MKCYNYNKYIVAKIFNLIENVLRNFTQRLPGLYSMNYCDRFSFCNLEPLEERWLHA